MPPSEAAVVAVVAQGGLPALVLASDLLGRRQRAKSLRGVRSIPAKYHAIAAMSRARARARACALGMIPCKQLARRTPKGALLRGIRSIARVGMSILA